MSGILNAAYEGDLDAVKGIVSRDRRFIEERDEVSIQPWYGKREKSTQLFYNLL